LVVVVTFVATVPRTIQELDPFGERSMEYRVS
jgi:hypothetical protein